MKVEIFRIAIRNSNKVEDVNTAIKALQTQMNEFMAGVAVRHVTQSCGSNVVIFSVWYEKDDYTSIQKLLSISLEDLELSVRTHKALVENAKIKTLGALCKHTENQLLTYSDFGKKGLREVKEKLKGLGISLGMTMPYGL